MSSAPTTTWSVTVVPVPPSLEHPDAWALHGAAAVSRAVDLAHWGYDDVAYTARYLLARLHEQQYATRIRLVATPAGSTGRAEDVVGTAYVAMPSQGNEHVADLEVTVLPDRRRNGVGSALLAEAERLAADHGRTTLIAASEHPGEPPADDPTALVPPTGSGRIRSDDAGATFARHHGYSLEQSERYSVLHLPPANGVVDRLFRDASLRAGSDYRLHAWTDEAPERWLDQYAGLFTRMSTDAPIGELDLNEDPWDGARVRTAERDIAAAGHGYLAVVAEHVPTSALAAFTMVEYPGDAPHVVFQEDTLVLREHRGRRLGMLVKAELLRRLPEHRPDAQRIHTWNAEENEHMLAINVALGFRPAGVSGLWRKRRSGPVA